MKNDASSVLFRRLPYFLSPQFDIYEKLRPFVKNKRVLEVGFGTGIGVLQYVNEASLVHAIEVDSAAVRFAKRCFPIKNTIWLEADITQWKNKGAYWDFIVMIEVLEHVKSPEDALANIRAKKDLGGQALITVPNMNRHRRKDEELNVQEWTPETFNILLLDYFANVKLLQEDLRSELFNRNTSATPIMALCS